MLIEAILNWVQKFKSSANKSVRWVESTESPELEMEVVMRANGRAICSGCGCQRPAATESLLDALSLRLFAILRLY
jgi:hypothetical protein